MKAGTLLLTPVKRKQTGIGNRRFVLKYLVSMNKIKRNVIGFFVQIKQNAKSRRS